jgi:hypothetical protein
MTNRIFATLSTLTLLTAASAFAQSIVMHVDIPFEFKVGETTLPAGRYDVRPEVAPHVLSIRCFECRAGAMIITNAVQEGKIPEKGKLVFKRYENTFFLSRVWSAGYSQGRELRKSKAERESVLKNPPVPTVVVLAQR